MLYSIFFSKNPHVYILYLTYLFFNWENELKCIYWYCFLTENKLKLSDQEAVSNEKQKITCFSLLDFWFILLLFLIFAIGLSRSE